MKHYQLRVVRRSPMFRGFRFDCPWLDTDSPVVSGDIRLLGAGVAEADLRVVDRNGVEVPFEKRPGMPLEEDKPLMAQPEANRGITWVSFQVQNAEPVSLVDRRDGGLLAIVEPYVTYPDFLFALMEESRRSGFAPDGFTNFVETGTLIGHTALHASYWVENAYTIELSEDLFRNARSSLAHRSNLKCLQGDSGDVLSDLCAELDGATLFFLDAHWSGDSSVDWEASKFRGYPVETARIEDDALSEGERQVPLKRELEAILNQHRGRALVVIDDWHTMGKASANFSGEDWSHLPPDEVLSWIDGHPRTVRHFQASWNRYAWEIEER